MLDLLLHRYHDINYVMSLDLETALRLIIKAKEEERDERIFRQWVAQLPLMAMSGETISFEDYRNRVTGANIDFRPTAEIMAELDDVERKFEVRKEE